MGTDVLSESKVFSLFASRRQTDPGRVWSIPRLTTELQNRAGHMKNVYTFSLSFCMLFDVNANRMSADINF